MAMVKRSREALDPDLRRSRPARRVRIAFVAVDAGIVRGV